MPLAHYLPDARTIEVDPDETLLDAALRAGIPHTHVCGGHARCSTCRVLTLSGLENELPRNAREQLLADRLRFPSEIRLACQTHLSGDVTLRRLVLDEDDIELTSQVGRAGESPNEVGQEKVVTILFADIRGFTTMSEALLPYDVVHLLNRYFLLMDEVITRHGGAIDNYMGDGFMALFEDEPDVSAQSAVRAGLEMLDAVEGFRPYLSMLYRSGFEIGIGVHTGEVVVGTIGAPGKSRMTAIGDAVNFASRIESANKTLGTRFLISDDTYARVSDSVRVGRQSTISIKGKTGDHTLYEVIGLISENA